MQQRGTAAENVLYILNLAVSVLVVYLLYKIVAASFASGGAAGSTGVLVITYVVLILLYVFFAKGLMIGRVRGNGVRLSERQFPEIYAIYRRQLASMGIRNEPALYCVQSNGILNAFAARVAFRNYVVMYSEILQAAYEEGEDAVSFVLAHELGHIKRNHPLKNLFIYPSFVLLPLRQAYSRACEFTCDRIGMSQSPRGVQGLLVLAAGRHLSRRINCADYVERASQEKGFWVWFSQFLSSHPNLPRRVSRVLNSSAGPASA